MLKVLICGDYCPCDRVQQLVESEKYKDVFGEVRQYTSQADYSIVNLEAPVVESKAEPIEKCGPNLKCSSKAIKALKYAGFNMVTLANNHFYDYGEEGVKDTLRVCGENVIDTVGGGVNISDASQTLYKEIKGVRLAFINCCEREFSIATDKSGGSNPLNPIQQYYAIAEAKKRADKTIVIVHGGHEHFNLPSPRMKETYRFFIDAGADVVINHHQHCYSGYEEYKGKPIFYGLGNFCFDRDSQRNTSWNEGYMVMLNVEDEISYDIIPYLQGNDSPGVCVLSKDEKFVFDDRIANLNAIISNDDQLISERDQFMYKTRRGYISSLEPYQNRYLSALYWRGVLPSTIGKRKMQLLNYLQCESHIDRLLYSLQNKDKK